MRYYDIFIPNAPGVFKRAPNGAIWSSHPWGDDRADPSAQQIEMRLELATPSENAPSMNSTLVVKGVSWEQIGQQAKLVGGDGQGLKIQIKGGMKPGLPLATFQSRSPLPGFLITEGRIIKAWGNWIRDEMSLGMNIAVSGPDLGAPSDTASSGGGSGPSGATPSSPVQTGALQLNRTGFRSINSRSFSRSGSVNLLDGGIGGILSGFDLSGLGTIPFASLIPNFLGGGIPGLSQPLNLIHNMLPNMPLSAAIQQTLSRAFPSMNIIMRISPALKLGYQDAGVYQNMTQYAQYIKKLSQSILGVKNYQGIKMTSDGKTITVDDGTMPITKGQIAPADLIGQPTWVDAFKVNITTVMRSDIHPYNVITLPPNILFAIGPGANTTVSIQRRNDSFTGSFRVQKITHTGDFRNPDGAFWSTSYECGTEDDPAFTAQGQAANAITNSNNAQDPNPNSQSSTDTSTVETPPTTPLPQSSMIQRSVRRYR